MSISNDQGLITMFTNITCCNFTTQTYGEDESSVSLLCRNVKLSSHVIWWCLAAAMLLHDIWHVCCIIWVIQCVNSLSVTTDSGGQ